MLKEKEAIIRKALIFLDAFIIGFSFIFSYFIRKNLHIFYKLNFLPSSQVIRDSNPSLTDYLAVLFIVILLWLGMLYMNGMYRSLRTRTLLEIVWRVIKSSLIALLVFSTIVFLFKLHFVSRVFFAIFFITCSAFILAEKIILFSASHNVQRRGYHSINLLIVGTGNRAAHFIRRIESHPEWGFQIIGAIDDEPGRGINDVNGAQVIGTLDDLLDILHTHAIDQVIFVVPRSRLSHMANAVYSCETEGIKATIAVDLFDLKIARSRSTEIDGIPLVTFETTVAEEWQLFIKRVCDIIISGLGIILLGPLLLIVAVLIKMTSSGPVLFKQERLGLNGRKFRLYKFRTMYEGSQSKLAKIDVFSDMNNPSFKNKKLQFISPIGRILRKFSIDEIPQLFNVFAGHMSLIGPRPSVPEEVGQYEPWQRRRLSMRPGLTCLWQIKGRNKLDFNEWMKLDLEYLDNWSLWLDVKIFIKTIPTVLFGIGAY